MVRRTSAQFVVTARRNLFQSQIIIQGSICLIFDEVLVRMCASRTFKSAHVISGLRWFDPA